MSYLCTKNGVKNSVKFIKIDIKQRFKEGEEKEKNTKKCLNKK